MNISPLNMTDSYKDRTVTPAEKFAATDACVMCGLCLPHCPTYLQTRNEADSPRGRIALIQALARGELSADKSLTSHLDGCLVCRACEDMCPSQVPYAHLIVTARAELTTHHNHDGKQTLQSGLLRQFTHNRNFRRLAHNLLRFWQVTSGRGLDRIIGKKRSEGVGRLLSLVPPLKNTPLIKTENTPRTRLSNTVQLFTGCAGEVFDRETLSAASRVLEHLGFQVHIPHEQTCCGGLALHSGNIIDARQLADQNRHAFRTDLPILSTASGCTTTLKEASTWFGEAYADLSNASEDICSFLQRADWSGTPLTPTHLRVAIQTPCTLQHVLHADSAIPALLARIPGIDLVDLKSNNHCCGAAGQYMLDHPKMADALVNDKIAELCKLAPDVLVSSNIGCSLHIQAAMRRAGISLEILHPVQLLARQLKGLAATKPLA